MSYFDFDGVRLSKIFKGNWQLAGGHGAIVREQAIADLLTYAEHGVNVFDVGDIYTGVEELVGEFLREHKRRFGKATKRLRVHTKFVPDINALTDLTKQDVRVIIERSCKRLGLEHLHLVQFHWWDYAKGDFVLAARYLDELRKEGMIEAIGLANFDCAHMKRLLDTGIPIKSNQVQFSLLDPRPLNGMLEFGKANNVAIFCYGVLAGGLLGGSRLADEPTDRSRIKYGLVIEEAGRAYYENIMQETATLAQKYGTSTANVAAAYVLQTSGVSSAILGPRNAKHIDELDQLDRLMLDSTDYQRLRDIEEELLATTEDDVYSYERNITGPHGQIMKYNLNDMRPD